MIKKVLHRIRYFIFFILLLSPIMKIGAVTDPYRAIIDKDIFLSGNKIFIIQFVYDFDYAKSNYEEYVQPAKYILVEKKIINGTLSTDNVKEYISYEKLLQGLINGGHLRAIRAEVGIEAEIFWYIIDGAYIEKNVSPVFKSDKIEIRNISSVFTFDGESPKEYKSFYLVQVDYLFKSENLYERYRKTVLVPMSKLLPYSDPDSFYLKLNS